MADPVRQPSFAGGELAPSLWGRTDLDRYGKGLRLLRDFFVSKQGEAVSRPGTRFIGRASSVMVSEVDSEIAPSTPIPAGENCRLIPFYFSDADGNQNYVLEFDVRGVRVWKNGVVVVDYGVIVTPYLTADLPNISYTQSLDVMVLACGGRPPATLTRFSDTGWVYEVIDFSVQQPVDASNATIVPNMDAQTLYVSDTSHLRRPRTWMVTQLLTELSTGRTFETSAVRVAAVRTLQGDPWVYEFSYNSGDVVSEVVSGTKHFFRSQLNNNQTKDPSGSLGGDFTYWKPTDTPGTSRIDTDWSVWNLVDSYAGPHAGFPNGSVVLSPNGAWFSAVADIAAPTPNPDTDGGVNWIPYTRLAYDMALDVDAGLVVTSDKPVTLNLSPGGIPAAAEFVCFRVYAGVVGTWGFIGDTITAQFIDYGATPDLTQNPPTGTNPFQVFDAAGTLLRTETPLTCAFFEDRLCFCGTDVSGNAFKASAAGDYFNFDRRVFPVDSSSLSFTFTARKHELAQWLMGKDKAFIGTNSSLWAAGGSNGAMSPTSVEFHVQVDIGSARVAPLQVGNLLLWVRNKSTGVRGVEFDFSRGSYVSHDLSFPAEHLVLGHQIVDWCFAEDPWSVVWAVREDGVVLSLSYSPDDGVWGWARHGICVQNDGTPQKVISICTIPENGHDTVYLAVADPSGGAAWILRFGARLELDDEALASIAAQGGGLEYGLGMGLGQTTGGGTTPYPSGFVGPGTPICLDAWTYASGIASDINGNFTLGSFPLFEGRPVFAIIDGTIYGPITVSGGVVRVVTGKPAFTASNLYVGLQFTPELELLNLPQEREKQKVVNEVVVEVLAHGLFKAGADLGHLDDHDMPDPKDDLGRVQVQGDWNSGGRAAIQQYLPLPLTVRAVTRKVRAGAG